MHSTMIYGVIALAASSAYARVLPAFEKRHAYGTEGSCAPQPLGSGPVTNQPDDADAFRANPVYDSMAQGAATPDGYTQAYQGLKAASSTGGYLGWEELTSYDVDYCASKCSGFWPGCTSFNIYLERNPTVDPAANCSNPSSTTRVKCSFWSQSLSGLDATNDGQYCSDFHIVIAGSNGYNAIAQETTTTTTTTASSTTTDVAVSTTSVTADTTSVAAPVTTSATTSVAAPVTTSATTSVVAPVTTSATTSVVAPVTTSATTSVVAPVTTSATTSVAAPVTTVQTTSSAKTTTTTSVAPVQTTSAKTTTTTCTTTSAKAPVTTSVTTLQTTSIKATTTTFKSTTMTTTMATTTKTTTQSPSPSGSISKCPTSELWYRAADGSTWALCKGTDYRGTTVQMIKNVASDSACAELCARAGNECVKAVYEPGCDICHLKGSPLTWAVDPKYNAMRQLTA